MSDLRSRRPAKPIEPMQAALEASVRRLPQLHLQRLIAKRADAMGLALKDHELEALAKHALAGNATPLELKERPGLTSATLTFTAEDSEEITGIAKRIKAEMPQMLTGIAKDASRLLLRRIRTQWPEIKAEHERNRASFAETIELLWGEALDKLDMLLATADSVGGQAIAAARASRSKKRIAVTAALDRLHVRGCQVATEVLTLLREGFADAAFSRWRTLHEISVVAMLLGDYGEGIAARYLDHDLVEAQRAGEEYQRCHPKDAAKRRNTDNLRRTKADYDAAVARYGPEFRTPYGWAAKHLGVAKPNFRDLEEAADQAQMRLQYKVASYGVHAGVKGITVSVADVFGEGPPGAASIGGLHEAGVETAYSLVRLTGSLLAPQWSIDKLAGLNALIALRDDAAKAFTRGARAMSEATWVSEEEMERWQSEAEAVRR
jgi:hypothetical protein